MTENNIIWSREQLAEGLGHDLGDWVRDPVGISSDITGATGFVIDSRQINGGEIFLPLVGKNQDGHDYIEQVIKNGAAGSLCLRDRVKNYSPDIQKKLIASDDVMADIKKLAHSRRKEIHKNRGKVLAITGSVGKTSVKEMVAHVLEKSGKKYYKSPANQNNTLGVPLCLLNSPADIKAGVYECGMNHAGELREIGETLCPDIVIITNIRENHIGYLGSLRGIAKAKGELLEHMMDDNPFDPPVAILEKTSGQYDFFNLLSGEFKNRHPHGEVISVGEGDFCDVRLKSARAEVSADAEYNFNISAQFKFFARELNYYLKTHGKHQALNSLFALAGLRYLWIDEDAAVVQHAQQLSTYGAPSGRGNSELLKIGNKRIVLIDESYNAAPASMKAALQNLVNYVEPALGSSKKARKIAILGDMKELGDKELEYHKEIVDIAQRSGAYYLIFVGHLMKQAWEHFLLHGSAGTVVSPPRTEDPGRGMAFDNVDEAIAELNKIIVRYDIIMVKASKAMGLVKIVKHLQNKANENQP
ncbi:MAG: UDP-N-acetylmuramoyl-tripeptide--D-alanyl-D-alanine ligase [Hydrotalea sp.]|nr:UDP-N-acetylmuramoyl-tripeptide--D-alanyl-D-alanine ligase [Hydrotalea sp.]